jgi:hypothetical protein
MKLRGRPDDLSLDPNALGATGSFTPTGWEARTAANGAKGGVFAGGGVIGVHWKYPLSGLTTYLNPGGTTTTTVIDTGSDIGVFSSFVFLNAFILVKGFTGGSGAFSAKLGVLSPNYEDLLLNKSCSANNDTISGNVSSELGSLLTHTISATAAYKPGFTFTTSTVLRLTIDGTTYTGPASAGFIHVHVNMLPLDWG